MFVYFVDKEMGTAKDKQFFIFRVNLDAPCACILINSLFIYEIQSLFGRLYVDKKEYETKMGL
jgi:hypothetical protein